MMNLTIKKLHILYENVNENDIDIYIPKGRMNAKTKDKIKKLIKNFKSNHYVDVVSKSSKTVKNFENIILYVLFCKLEFLSDDYHSKWKLSDVEKIVLNSKLDKEIMKKYNNIDKLRELEQLEEKYLTKYEYFMRFIMDELLEDLSSKNRIKLDWENHWKSEGISSYNTGAERIVYAHLNGKGIGDVNSAPVGSDLFFELKDAFIHIDLKTAVYTNKTEYYTYINVGNNQTSYESYVYKNNAKKLIYEESTLPQGYTLDNDSEKIRKPCLTYFISLLFDKDKDKLLSMSISSMPNGKLEQLYGSNILQTGKNVFGDKDEKEGKDKEVSKDPNKYQKTIRYNQFDNLYFKTICDKTRIRVLYVDQDEKENLEDDQHKNYYLLEKYLYKQSSATYDIELKKIRDN